MCYIRFTVMLIVIFSILSCVAITPEGNYIIAIDKWGNPVNPENQKILAIELYNDQIKAVLDTELDKIVIYIHGGLNVPSKSVERTNELSPLMIKDKYHPVFIHWRSGFFTTYYDHLFNQRQGEYWPLTGFLTSPFVLIEDLARGVSRTPMVWLHKTNSYFKGVTFDNCNTNTPSERNAVKLSCTRLNNNNFGDIIVPSLSTDTRTGYEKTAQVALGGLQLASGLVTAPLFDAAGTGAWDVMNQRTEILFARSKPYKAEDYDDIKSYSELRESPLTKFLKYLATIKDKKIILVGHSMGTIIVNKILAQYPDIEFSRIVYLAAACSIRDFQYAVVPYMRTHPDTKFFNYTLHPVAENLESHGYGLGGTGSLLNQIDNFYENPVFENQRTLGKWVNVMNGINFLNIEKIKSRIYLRTMPLDKNYPTKHGEFDDPKFSKKVGTGFWTENFGK